MVLNPAGEDVLVLCEACGYAANRQVAVVPKPEPAGRGAPAARGGRDARHDDDRHAGRVPRRRPRADGQGGVLRDRRRPARDGDRPRRPRGQRDQAGQRGQARPAASGRRTVEEIKAAGMEPGYGSPIGAQRHGRRHRRPRGPLAEPRRRAPTARASTTGTSTPAATSRPTSWPTSPTPRKAIPARTAARRSSCATASRSATSSSSGRSTPTPPAPPTSARTASAHPIVMGSYGIGVGRNVACIVEAHHDDKGIVWPAEVAPYAAHLVSIGAAKEPRVHRDRRAAPRARRRGRAGTRSCGTTATSRPA